MTKALVIVDVQNDFCEGGSLAVEGGGAVAAAISMFVGEHASDYAVIVATKDWHVDPGDHFAVDSTPDYLTTWPVHCAAGTDGAAFHPALKTDAIDAVFVKGEYEAAYSGFEGVHQETGQTLENYLRERGIDAIDVAGIATDYCARATALDGAGLGLQVRLFRDLTAGVAPDTTDRALDEMVAAGVEVATTSAA